MPYTYTNRQGKTHYFRAVETKYGKWRYYVTTSDQYANLIEDIPDGYEIIEQPEEARVVIRKNIPIKTTQQEKRIVYDAITDFSAINDFFIYAESVYLYVYHSQFNSAGGHDKNLTRQEVIESFGEEMVKHMRFISALRFKLINEKKRLFQTERVIQLSYYGHTFNAVGNSDEIQIVTKEYGQHLGRQSFFDILPDENE